MSNRVLHLFRRECLASVNYQSIQDGGLGIDQRRDRNGNRGAGAKLLAEKLADRLGWIEPDCEECQTTNEEVLADPRRHMIPSVYQEERNTHDTGFRSKL